LERTNHKEERGPLQRPPVCYEVVNTRFMRYALYVMQSRCSVMQHVLPRKQVL
jgi:hypothetical protein